MATFTIGDRRFAMLGVNLGAQLVKQGCNGTAREGVDVNLEESKVQEVCIRRRRSYKLIG